MYGYGCDIQQDEFEETEKLAFSVRLDYSLYDEFIDIFEFVQEKLHVTLHKYSELSDEELARAYACSEHGFTAAKLNRNGNLEPHIYYNDWAPIGAQRYTLAHEVKHIVLHEWDPTLKEDKLADYFAKVFLAPCVFVLRMDVISTESIMEKFGLSYSASFYLVNRMTNRINKYGKEIFAFEMEFVDEINNNCVEWMYKKRGT